MKVILMRLCHLCFYWTLSVISAWLKKKSQRNVQWHLGELFKNERNHWFQEDTSNNANIDLLQIHDNIWKLFLIHYNNVEKHNWFIIILNYVIN